MVTYTSPKFLARLPPPPLGVSTPLTGGQGLLQFLGLLFVCDDQGVKVSAAPNFKLHIILIFLDLDRFGILSSGFEQEVFDLLNFGKLSYEAWRACSRYLRLPLHFPHTAPETLTADKVFSLFVLPTRLGYIHPY